MTDATTDTSFPANPALGGLSVSFPADASQLLKKQQQEKQKLQQQESTQFQEEQSEHKKSQAEIDKLTAESESDLNENRRLSDMNPDELSKYLNLGTFTQPPERQSMMTASAAKKFVPMLIAFALLGGRMGGKQFGLQDAFAGMAGVLKGMKAGNEQQYQDAYQKWKDSTDQIVNDNKTKIQAYQDTLQNRNLNLDQKLQLLQILTVHDPYTHALVKGADLSKISDHVDSLQKSYDKFVEHYTKTDSTLKPMKVDKDVIEAVKSVMNSDHNLPKPDASDPTKNAWYSQLVQRQASFSQFLMNEAAQAGKPITPYEAAMESWQEAYKSGVFKKGMTGPNFNAGRSDDAR